MAKKKIEFKMPRVFSTRKEISNQLEEPNESVVKSNKTRKKKPLTMDEERSSKSLIARRASLPAGKNSRKASLIPKLFSEIGIDETTDDSFWVPKELAQRRPSLVPSEKDSVSAEELSDNGNPESSRRSARRASMFDPIDPTKMEKKFYDRGAGSLCESNEAIQASPAKVNVEVWYEEETTLLGIRLVRATGLIPRTRNGTISPYAKIFLLPEKKMLHQTKVHQKTSDPEFEDEFLCQVDSKEALLSHTLDICFFDYDKYSNDECIGAALVVLSSINSSPNKRAFLTSDIHLQQDQGDYGDLMVSMSYLPSAERLTITVLKARNLFTVRENLPDPYVKVSVIPKNNKKVKKKKTASHRMTINPSFTEALSFDISRSHLLEGTIYIAVICESLTDKEELGFIVFERDSGGMEEKQFQELLERNNSTARWYPLKRKLKPLEKKIRIFP